LKARRADTGDGAFTPQFVRDEGQTSRQ